MFRLPLRLLAVVLPLLLPIGPTFASDHSGDVLDDQGVTFMLNAVGGLMIHEFGHSLIRETQSMVLGNEETAADNFVPVMLFKPSEVLDGAERAMMLADHANSWLYAAKQFQDRLSLQGLSYYDEHDTDIRRAYTMMCLMVGGSKSTFGAMASAYNIPDERQDDCTTTLIGAQLAWDKALAPAEQTGAPGKITVTYEESADYAPYREALMQGGILEKIASFITEKYKLEDGNQIVARDCGGSGDATSKYRVIEFCYSRAEFFYYLWDRFGRDDESRNLVKADASFSDDTANGTEENLSDEDPATEPSGDSDDNQDE